MHRLISILGLVLHIAGFVIGLVKLGGGEESLTLLHLSFGCIVTIIGCLQPIGYFRDHFKGSARTVWTFVHTNLGRLGVLIALANILIGAVRAK
jgi:hypothetical protein